MSRPKLKTRSVTRRADPNAMFRVIQGSRPYGEANPKAATGIMVKLRLALQRLSDMATPDDDIQDHDELMHALAVALVRSHEIAGSGNPCKEPLMAGVKALQRASERRARKGRWGLDGPGIQELREALDIYEEVLMASSPKQMQTAFEKHLKMLLKALQQEEVRHALSTK